MGLIPLTDETLIEIYRCGHCQKAYMAQVGQVRSLCGVDHAPGTCCHYGEHPVSEETLREVRELLAKVPEEKVAEWDNGDPDPVYTFSVVVQDGLQAQGEGQ